MKLYLMVLLLVSISACSSAPKNGTSKAVDIEARAESYYKDANLQLAETEYRKLVELVPLYAEGWFRLGNIYLRTNQLDAAINHYTKAISYDPKMAKAWHNLSLTRIRQATNVLIESKQKVMPEQAVEIDLLLNKLLSVQRTN